MNFMKAILKSDWVKILYPKIIMENYVWILITIKESLILQ